MNLMLPFSMAERYKSASQKARIASETWVTENVYCPACASNDLRPTRANTQAVDFYCPQCESPYQLKATRNKLGRKINDAAYAAMMKSITEDRLPHLLLLHYNIYDAMVNDLIVIPHFSIPQSAIEKRKPLSMSARRAGWVGCNILLDHIPADAFIPMIESRIARVASDVRSQFELVKPFSNLSGKVRGWTLDVYTVLRNIGQDEFNLREAYQFETLLKENHPENRHFRPKIRQQLQVLRDLGYLDFTKPGNYRWRVHE